MLSLRYARSSLELGGTQPLKSRIDSVCVEVCVRWDNASNPVSCIRPGLWSSAWFACQNFSTGASGHPEAARPDVQPSGMRQAAPSLTLQTLNNVHRSLQLMSPPHRAHGVRALPAVSIRSSVSGEQSFLCLGWHRTKDLDTKCKSALSSLRSLQCACVTWWWRDTFLWIRVQNVGEREARFPVEC